MIAELVPLGVNRVSTPRVLFATLLRRASQALCEAAISGTVSVNAVGNQLQITAKRREVLRRVAM